MGRGVKRAQPDTPAADMDRAQRKGRGQNPSRDGAFTAQTPASGHAVFAVPASALRLGVEGATEELGARAGTQTPGAPAAGRSAAATRQRGKHALSHDDSAVPLMAPLTPALKSSNDMLVCDEAVVGESSRSAIGQLAGVAARGSVLPRLHAVGVHELVGLGGTDTPPKDCMEALRFDCDVGGSYLQADCRKSAPSGRFLSQSFGRPDFRGYLVSFWLASTFSFAATVPSMEGTVAAAEHQDYVYVSV
jgi:hypothetical protein